MRIPLLLLVIILNCLQVFCQDTLQKKNSFEQQDIKDWLIQKKWVKKKPEKTTFTLLIPIVASNPTAGFIFGVGLTSAFKSWKQDEHFSSLNANATYSTKGILNLNVKGNVFLLHEKLVMNADWRYQVNTETTYGLGTNKYASGNFDLNGYEVNADSVGQPLTFHQVRLHTTFSYKLFTNFFAGIGIQYDYRYDIDDPTSKRDTSLSVHYRYSRQHGFDPNNYTTSGIGLNFLFDSRDNQVNAYKGYYANLNYLFNTTWMGSNRNSSLLLLEYRSFHALDGAKQRHILSFWLYGNFLTSGDAPYLALPALGYDQRQRTGRGFAFGRFRGEDLLYGESEYRFPISPNTGILGGVLFVNATSASNHQTNLNLLEYIRIAWGGGLRIMLDKKTRTRLQIDAGIANKAVGFYFGAQEAF